MSHPRLFVGGPLHGQRIELMDLAWRFEQPLENGFVTYTAMRFCRQQDFYGDDGKMIRIVYRSAMVMADPAMERRINEWQTRPEAEAEVNAMLTDGDFDPSRSMVLEGQELEYYLAGRAELDRRSEQDAEVEDE